MSLPFVPVVAMIVMALPGVVFAQTALNNGTRQAAVLQVGGLDTWTFTATRNDGITVSLGKVPGSGPEPIFGPWIRLKAPDGSLLAQDAEFSNATSATIDSRAPLTGTYTVLVANNYSNQASPASYVISLAKTPGPYAVSSGDEGGALTNGHRRADPRWGLQREVRIGVGVDAGGVDDQVPA